MYLMMEAVHHLRMKGNIITEAEEEGVIAAHCFMTLVIWPFFHTFWKIPSFKEFHEDISLKNDGKDETVNLMVN